MSKQYSYEGEEWVHKDGSGSVIINAMFKHTTFYTSRSDKLTCGTKEFKIMYKKR